MQLAPSVSVSVSEELGFKQGRDINGVLIATLRKIGFQYVFETSFGADVASMEVANELQTRIDDDDSIPLLSSCCAAWVKYLEQFYPALLPLLSKVKSPQQVLGAIIKEHWAQVAGLNSQKLFSVAIMDTVMPFAIQMDVKVNGSWPDEIYMDADSDEIEIILNNLLSNAVKYNRTGGKVQFNILRDTENVTIRVEDTGIGIAQEDTDRLFDEFMRVRSPETKNISGSGLGLSIVKRIVKMNNGKILVESKPGIGSVFTIILPVACKPI